jgi:topoisomerase IV subunit A
MLAFDVASLPQMAKGKGNKMISIPSARAADREELVVALACVQPDDLLIAHAGKRFISFAAKELEEYLGERGRRGLKLPRGLQRIDSLEVKVGEGKLAKIEESTTQGLLE